MHSSIYVGWNSRERSYSPLLIFTTQLHICTGIPDVCFIFPKPAPITYSTTPLNTSDSLGGGRGSTAEAPQWGPRSYMSLSGCVGSGRDLSLLENHVSQNSRTLLELSVVQSKRFRSRPIMICVWTYHLEVTLKNYGRTLPGTNIASYGTVAHAYVSVPLGC